MARFRGHREEGAVLIVVLLSVALVMGAGMLTVDAGSVWVARRALVSASDAAALAASRAHAGEDDPSYLCGGSDLGDLVVRNAPGATITDCEAYVTGSGTGYVSVGVRSETIEIGFGKALGVGDSTITGRSAARWGAPTTMRGLRPIVICEHDPHVSGWIGTGSDGTADHPSPGVHRIRLANPSAEACGSAQTNWDVIDYDGGSTPNTDLYTWLVGGYPGDVGIDDCNADGVTGDPCYVFPGNRTGVVERGLSELLATGEPFTLALYDRSAGSGTNTGFHISGFLGVRLHGYLVNGAAADRYLDLEFTDLLVDGTCCSDRRTTGVLTTALCSVDGAGTQPESTRCGA